MTYLLLNRMSDQQLTNSLRSLRMQMRPIQAELNRRGYTITEVHGRSRVPVTGFENICVTKKKVERL